MGFLMVFIIIGINVFFLYKKINFTDNRKINLKFFKNSYKLIINGKEYKYSDIKSISVDLDIYDNSGIERYVMGDFAHGRLVNDRINFILTNELIDTVETHSRGALYKILKQISLYKKLDFDINEYKPPFVTFSELILLVVGLIYVYILIQAYS